MAWKWYAVKTIYRTTVSGKPKGIDKHFDPHATMVEERVVLFKARSFKEAIFKAEKEAGIYAKKTKYINPYGQNVKQRYTGDCDAYELCDIPGPGAEIYSSTEIVKSSISNREIGNRRIGTELHDNMDHRRKKFLNGMFSNLI